MDNLTALKALYTALGGNSATVLGATMNLDVLNGISAVLNGETGDDIASAITAIAAVAGDSVASLTTKTITATTSKQTVKPGTGYNGFSSVTVNAVTAAIDENIVAGNIKSGVTILGVTGSYTGD
jgi:hypothetical protein